MSPDPKAVSSSGGYRSPDSPCPAVVPSALLFASVDWLSVRRKGGKRPGHCARVIVSGGPVSWCSQASSFPLSGDDGKRKAEAGAGHHARV